MNESRVVVWFSCGAASAVAAKLAIAKYGNLACIVYCDTMSSEHADNERFFDDVQRWLGREIITIKSAKYNNIDDVFEKRRYMSGIKGAICTTEMKKIPRFQFQLPDDIHVFGLTFEEQNRIENFEKNNPDLSLDWVLRENAYSKKRCIYTLEQAGICLPKMYELGFANNNCIGCVKATSPAYWQRVRRNFPEVFERRAKLSREIGVTLARINNERRFLDELPPDDAFSLWARIEDVTEDLSCGPQCATN